jgi:hypothetical protein
MRRTARRVLGVGLASGTWMLLPACEPGGVGDPCTPEAEYNPDFGGFDLREVYVESASFQCETRLCLINHFQGRVSCPYGQTPQGLSLPGDHPERCRLPGWGEGAVSEVVTVPVRAWNTERPASRAVYCSCRCDGPEPNARYCSCPAGYVCRSLVPDLKTSSQQLVGSYCVKAGSDYQESDAARPSCSDSPAHDSCPNEPLVNP